MISNLTIVFWTNEFEKIRSMSGDIYCLRVFQAKVAFQEFNNKGPEILIPENLNL